MGSGVNAGLPSESFHQRICRINRRVEVRGIMSNLSRINRENIGSRPFYGSEGLGGLHLWRRQAVLGAGLTPSTYWMTTPPGGSWSAAIAAMAHPLILPSCRGTVDLTWRLLERCVRCDGAFSDLILPSWHGTVALPWRLLERCDRCDGAFFNPAQLARHVGSGQAIARSLARSNNPGLSKSTLASVGTTHQK